MGNWRGDLCFCAGIHIFPIYLIKHAVIWIPFLQSKEIKKQELEYKINLRNRWHKWSSYRSKHFSNTFLIPQNLFWTFTWQSPSHSEFLLLDRNAFINFLCFHSKDPAQQFLGREEAFQQSGIKKQPCHKARGWTLSLSNSSESIPGTQQDSTAHLWAIARMNFRRQLIFKNNRRQRSSCSYGLKLGMWVSLVLAISLYQRMRLHI